MGISPRLLGDGEYVVVSTRTHAKALVGPVLVFIAASAVAGFLMALVPSGQPWLRWVIAAMLLVAVLTWVVRPLLRWLGASYTVTNRRLITRSGILTRVGRDLPLQRITDVSYERQLLDRVLGCGTLVVSAASERGQIRLPDVPSVERLHLTLTELLFAEDADEAYDDEPDADDMGGDGEDAGYR